MLGHILSFLLFLPTLVLAQTNQQLLAEVGKLAWQRGPTVGKIADKATIAVPEGFAFLDAPNTRRFLELSGNPPRDGHYLLAAGTWWAVFSFDPSGYVQDDEKVDPDELLAILKKSDGPSNEERRRLGMEPLYTEGWQVPPHYDMQSKHLEWGTKLRTEGGDILVNYTSRMLGRSGVMSAILVSTPNDLAEDTRQFKASLKEFSFAPGQGYSEFRAGDKVAEYGLTALIVGGAAAAAAKSGLLKSLGKFFWVAILAVGGAVWAFIKRMAARRAES